MRPHDGKVTKVRGRVKREWQKAEALLTVPREDHRRPKGWKHHPDYETKWYPLGYYVGKFARRRPRMPKPTFGG